MYIHLLINIFYITAIKFQLVKETAMIPVRIESEHTIYDLYCSESSYIWPKTYGNILIGVKVWIPNGFYGLIYGVDYTRYCDLIVINRMIVSGDNLMLVVHNVGTTPFMYDRSTSIAQLIVQKYGDTPVAVPIPGNEPIEIVDGVEI